MIMTFAEYKQAHKEDTKNERYLWEFIGNLEKSVKDAESVDISYSSAGTRASYVMTLILVIGDKRYKFSAATPSSYGIVEVTPSIALSYWKGDEDGIFVGKYGWELLDGDNPLGFKVGDILTLVRYIEELVRVKNNKTEKWWE